MRRYNKIYAKYCEDEFENFMSDVCEDLRHNNQDYHSKIIAQKKLEDKYPKLKEFIYYLFEQPTRDITLNKRELFALGMCMKLFQEQLYLEKREMFIRGMKEQYFIFKRQDLLK